MTKRLTFALTAAVLVTVCPTQTYAKDTFKTAKMPVSLTGCIERETDYRRDHHLGKGGFLGFGGGLGNEYVLVNCATGGDAYELTGHGEGDLAPFVGQRMVINGTRKAAEVDALTGRPTGGRQAGYDLRLFEVDVDSFAPAPVATRTVARVRQRPTVRYENRSARAPVQRQQDVDATGQLPGTASALPAIGLFGLVSVAAGLILRSRERRS